MAAIFSDPPRSNVSWLDIEALLLALGAERYEGNGSRVRFLLNGVKATILRPHPHKETDKGALLSVRGYLITGGVQP